MKLRWSRQFPWVRAETDEQIRVRAFFADVRQKTWVQVLTTGELAVLDHLKPCRRYGVRPVDLKNAAYFPSEWEHWPMAYRIHWPREYDLSEDDFRILKDDELPEQIRN